MTGTKEKILHTALRHFARDGYEAASVTTIAGELGMTKSALYKHYKNKQDILDSIVARMKQNNAEQAAAFDVPAGSFKNGTAANRKDMFRKIKSFSLAMFRYWTQDEFASSFRRMLTLEQYRNPEMATLLNQYLTGGVLGHTKDLIRESATGAASRKKDPGVLAIEYFAPIYMMVNMYDGAEDKAAIETMVEQHIDYFMKAMER
jgi:AcrR family transcriptional regulator